MSCVCFKCRYFDDDAAVDALDLADVAAATVVVAVVPVAGDDSMGVGSTLKRNSGGR